MSTSSAPRVSISSSSSRPFLFFSALLFHSLSAGLLCAGSYQPARHVSHLLLLFLFATLITISTRSLCVPVFLLPSPLSAVQYLPPYPPTPFTPLQWSPLCSSTPAAPTSSMPPSPTTPSTSSPTSSTHSPPTASPPCLVSRNQILHHHYSLHHLVAVPGPSSSSPRLDFDSLNLTNTIGEYSYTSSYTTASPGRPYTPPENGISPPAVYNLSAGELSSDGLPSGRRSRGSGTHSPASVHSVPYAAVPRSHRFNPIAPPATRAATKAARRKSRNEESDEEDDDFQPVASSSNTTDARRETIRKQRIESEQRRRDELRDGYRRLKDALPVSNQKSSKVSLLDRATTHVKYLEMTAQQLQARLQQAETEVQRLRT